MSAKNSQSTTSRDAKRARFDGQPGRPGGPSPLILVAGLLIVLVLIGGSIFAAIRPGSAAGAAAVDLAPAAEATLPDLDAARTGSQGLLVKAATVGHEPYPLVEAEDGVVRLPLATFDDYQARHYTYMHEGRPIEFFVVKSRDGTVRAAFNACDVCYPARRGYTQDGDTMVCNNCGRRFPTDQINVVAGGCNPAPLTRTVEGDTLLIQVEDIVQGLGYFS